LNYFLYYPKDASTITASGQPTPAEYAAGRKQACLAAYASPVGTDPAVPTNSY